MTKFVVLDAEGEEVEVEADTYEVDGDGFLIFSVVEDAFGPNEWHTVTEDVEVEDEADEDEDETVEDLIDRLEETFSDDDLVLDMLDLLRDAVDAEDR